VISLYVVGAVLVVAAVVRWVVMSVNIKPRSGLTFDPKFTKLRGRYRQDVKRF
jgi:hypothetical protein